MTAPRSIAQEAHEQLLARDDLEGDALELVWRVADAVSRRTGRVVTAEAVLWIQVELALERHRRAAPGDGRHLRDAVVHLALLARFEAVALAESAADATGSWTAPRRVS